MGNAGAACIPPAGSGRRPCARARTTFQALPGEQHPAFGTAVTSRSGTLLSAVAAPCARDVGVTGVQVPHPNAALVAAFATQAPGATL